MKIKIGLVDDHQLFLKSLRLMLESLQGFEVVVEALNGADLQEKLTNKKKLPDIIVLDVNMPVMDGAETAKWLQKTHPGIKLVALSMNDKDNTIIRMIRAGCCAYILKDIHPSMLEEALHQVYEKGYFNSDVSNIHFRRLLVQAEDEMKLNITPKELEFLQLACSDLTYKEIATAMNLSERTIDGYRESLFQKLHVQSRVGLCLEALRKELVSL